MTANALKRGNRAAILSRLAISERPRFEGYARLIAPIDEELGLWRIQFEGERQTRIRLVHGGSFQTNVEAIVDALASHFIVSVDPTLLLDPKNPFNIKR